jgi:signal transduction histidine kinase
MRATHDARTRLIDGGVAAAVLGVSWLSVFVAHDVGGEEARSLIPVWSEYVLLAVMIAPLAWRRRWPLATLATVAPLSLIAFGAQVPDPWGPTLALFLALYTAGARSRDRWRDPLRIATCVATMGMVAWNLLHNAEAVGFDLLLLSGYAVVVNAGFLVAAWLLGDAARTRDDNERELERRARELAENQREREHQAIMTERVRMARELHDVVAHHVSVMGIQASAAQRVLDADQTAARDALTTVAQSGRDAVDELQRLVGLLRQSHPDDGLYAAPQPTLDDLARLVDGCGLPASLRRVGRPRQVPASVALSAYRIVQEALTNVLKHAGHVRTVVVVTYAAEHLQVEVVNDGGDAQLSDMGAGRGILGMRERVAMLGGELSHGTATGGGYRVFAALPTAGSFDPQPSGA